MATQQKQTKYLFIGGGLANATAAKEVRKRDPDATILLISGENHLPYNRPPLSKEYLRGEATFAEALVAPQEDWASQDIDLQLGTKVTGLDTAAHTALLGDGTTMTYEKVCIATGSSAKKLDPAQMPGADNPNVLTLRTVDDSNRLRVRLMAGQRAIILGAGYIGMEVAASAQQKGLEVTVIDPGQTPWGKFASPTFGSFLRRYYENQGVRFRFGDQATSVETSGDGIAVRTKGGERFVGDFVLAGVGAALNLELPKAADLKVDDKQGVFVNEYLESETPGLFVAGDIAYFQDPVLGKRWHAEHWQNAEWHGQIAGVNLTGERVAYDHIPYFFSDEFDLHMTLRGDPQAGKSSFFIGQPSVNGDRFLELYLRENGTLAMGLIISKEEDESKTADLLERLIRARTLVATHQEALIKGTKQLEEL